MFQYSYLPQELYRSPYVQAIAGATGGADRARAAAEQQQGQIASQEASNIGNIASGTLKDFLSYRMDEPRRQLQTAQAGLAKTQLADKQRDDADTNAMRQALQDSGGDHDSALQALDARGAVGAATKLRTALTEGRLKLIDEQDKGLKLVKDKLGAASQMLQGVPGADDPWTAYANVLPKVRETIGPDLSKHLPDDYEPDTVNQAISWGETAQQSLERRRAALEAAKEGVANSKDVRDKDQYFTKSLSQWLPTVSDQDEWTKALNSAKALGAPPETLAKFGDAFTPEAAKRAESFGLTAEERAKGNQPPKAGTIEDYMTTYARDVAKKPVGALSLKDKDAALKRYAQDHKVDSAGEITADKRADLVATILKYPSVYHDLTDTTKSAIAGDLSRAGFTQFERTATPATIAAAERWRSEELTKLDKRYETLKVPDGKKPVPGMMTSVDYQAEKDRIDASYKAQVGKADATPKPAAAAPPAAAGAKPAVAPAAAKPPTTAANVAEFLKDQPSNKRYTLTDGSVWEKLADGTIRPGQPRR